MAKKIDTVSLDIGYALVTANLVTLAQVPNSARYDCDGTDYHYYYSVYWDGATAYAVKTGEKYNGWADLEYRKYWGLDDD